MCERMAAFRMANLFLFCISDFVTAGGKSATGLCQSIPYFFTFFPVLARGCIGPCQSSNVCGSRLLDAALCRGRLNQKYQSEDDFVRCLTSKSISFLRSNRVGPMCRLAQQDSAHKLCEPVFRVGK